jgi:hypothetical protein
VLLAPTGRVATAVLACGLLAQTSGRPAVGQGTTGATQPISPVAMVSWVAHYETEGVRVLDLLVLWRGTPGWFLKGNRRGTSGGGGQDTYHSTIQYGGLELEFDVEWSTGFVRIQGNSIALDDSNVVLVDHVDGATGPEVVGTLRVDPTFLGPEPDIVPVLRRSPEILAFLRCEVPAPDPKAQPMFDAICVRLAGG